jgi:hypothetical protein
MTSTAPPRRRTHKLFDALFARLTELSDPALVVFINALFSTNFSLDAHVNRMTTNQHDGRRPRHPDLVLKIGTTFFHLEAQTGWDGHIAVRVFAYGYQEAVRHRHHDRHGLTILQLPQARVVYLERRPRSTAPETLRLVFPDGSHHDYHVESFAIAGHDPLELDALGLDVLLPFVPLRLRGRVQRADADGRAAIAGELADLIGDMTDALRLARAAGRISATDEHLLVDLADELVDQEYVQRYAEFKEANPMATQVRTRVERAYDNGLEQGRELGLEQAREGQRRHDRAIAGALLAKGLSPEETADITGLPVDDIRQLG